MPRKSVKGTSAICKAPTPDGGKCGNQFIRNKDRASDHKFCSNRCRNRNDRAKKRKKDKDYLKSVEKSKSNLHESLKAINILSGIHDQLIAKLDIIDSILIPIPIPPVRSMTTFDTTELYYQYNQYRDGMVNSEKQRINSIETKPKHDDEAKIIFGRWLVVASEINSNRKDYKKNDMISFYRMESEARKRVTVLGVKI